MTPVIVIRPQPGCDATLAAARDRGLEAHCFPLFTVHPVAWDTPATEEVDALLIGSANALRHGGPGLDLYRGKSVYAVGQATADAARAAEFDVVATGPGRLQDTLELLRPEHRRLLRLAGSFRVAVEPPEGVTIVERTVYASEPQPMPAALADMLQQPALVLLHSAEAARHLAHQCDTRGIDRSRIALAAISSRVAEAAGSGWAALRSAPEPSDAAVLALAGEMCQESGRLQERTAGDAQTNLMQDETSTPQLPAARQPRSRRPLLLVAALAFLAGAVLVGWLASRGDLARLLPPIAQSSESLELPSGEPTALGTQVAGASEGAARGLDALSAIETRLALLEDRLSRASLEANAASGNAARAEGLLIAFAARRLIDKGERLGYLENQLKLRFGGAQPIAVDTVITFSKKPVTIDELASRLTALAPELTGRSPDESAWSRVGRDLSRLFVLHRSTKRDRRPSDRLQRAKRLLTSGRIDEAIAQVASLPGADAAKNWIADAHRYAAVERALDLIETAAMLEPRRLQDSEGNKVEQPSPLAGPPNAPEAP